MTNRRPFEWPWRQICASAVWCLGAMHPAMAQTRIDAAAMYLVPGAFDPGGVALTQLVFYSVDPIELSSFSFSLRWDSDQVALATSGEGSMPQWQQTLAAYGVLSWQQVSTTEIAGQWAAAGGPSGPTVLPVSPSQRIAPLLHFQTSPAQTGPFTVTFEFPGLRYADGVPVDTGSGFYNSVTLTPVPEPGAAWMLMLGALLLALRRRSA